MVNDYLEFSKKLDEENIEFILGYDKSYRISMYGPTPLIKLDQEDVQYFKRKYLPKVNDQFHKELKKLKSKYGRDISD